MYNYIKGKISESTENMLVVEAAGVGYELNVSSFTAAKLSGETGDVKVYCYLSVREDGMTLFGFESRTEKAMFEKLIAVSGVGPKLAITVLSGMNISNFSAAVVRGDVVALSKIKGVGKKTAERIVLELKDKVDKEVGGGDVMTVAPVNATVNEDAVMALMTLGYSKAEAVDAVSKVNTDGLTLEQIIFNALRNA